MEDEYLQLNNINWIDELEYSNLSIDLDWQALLQQEYHDIQLTNQWNEVRERGLQPGKTYDISSGTGFYVAPGYVLTNQHVVNDCINISVRGAIPPAAAALIANDRDIDLALLKIDINSPNIVNFRNNEGLPEGSKIFIVGYPMGSADGIYFIKDGNIIATKGLIKETKEVEFTNITEKGNSGGPLIDTSGNVVGVVCAKKNYYHSLGDSNNIDPQATPYKTHGLAIGLSLIKQFLDNNNIRYSSSDSNAVLTDLQIDLQANNYIVNIHCVKK
jgi:S1-C subfamily serine protease